MPIVAAVTVQEHLDIGVPATAGRQVDVYDFRRPTTLAREHSRVLELAFETFARQWATQLTAKVRVICQVTSEHVLMQSYNEYAASLPHTTAMVLCSIEGIVAKAVIQFPTSAALYWIDHMLGGHGTSAAQDRKFTQIEQALVHRLMDDALEGLHYSLGSLLTRHMTVDAIHYNSQFAQAAPTADLMIVVGFEIRVGESSCHATVAIPADLLIPQLGEANPASDGDNASELIQAQLANVPVDVALQLAPVTVKPGQILDLAVGDVLPLPHPQHRPLNVMVNGNWLAHAAAGVSGSRLACVVVNTEEKST